MKTHEHQIERDIQHKCRICYEVISLEDYEPVADKLEMLETANKSLLTTLQTIAESKNKSADMLRLYAKDALGLVEKK